MHRMRSVVLCLVAVGALSALCAPQAPARPPEWGRCLASTKGEYSNASCTDKVGKGGTYEWKSTLKMAHKRITIEGGEAVLTGVGGSKTTWAWAGPASPVAGLGPSMELSVPSSDPTAQECAEKRGVSSNEWSEAVQRALAETSEEPALDEKIKKAGEELDEREKAIAQECEPEEEDEEEESDLPGGGPKEIAHVLLAFRGCLGSTPCGELKTSELRGELGFISGGGTSTPSVGIDLRAPRGSRTVAEFGRAGRGTVVVGRKKGAKQRAGVISQIEPLDQMTTAFTQRYGEQAPGVQNPTKFEGGKEEILEATTSGDDLFEQAALTLTATDTTKEPVEIRAYCEGC